jgi:hypothetical protein
VEIGGFDGPDPVVFALESCPWASAGCAAAGGGRCRATTAGGGRRGWVRARDALGVDSE